MNTDYSSRHIRDVGTYRIMDSNAFSALHVYHIIYITVVIYYVFFNIRRLSIYIYIGTYVLFSFRFSRIQRFSRKDYASKVLTRDAEKLYYKWTRVFFSTVLASLPITLTTINIDWFVTTRP